MRIAIVGAGFTGLAAGLELVRAGHKVVIFEKEKSVGGLAMNFEPKDWDWGLEKYYHHIFANDKAVIELAKSVGWPAFFTRPATNSLIGGKQKQLDSPLSLLMFNRLRLVSRLYMGMGLVSLKIIKNGLWLEKYRVVDVLPKLVGREGYKKVWKPLLKAKFGPYLPKVNMAWFWARVHKRTAKLGYFKGGFGKLAEKIAEEVEKNGGEIRLKEEYKPSKEFSKVLFTIPAPLIAPSLQAADGCRTTVEDTTGSEPPFARVDYLWGQTLVLELDRSLMRGYWLNVLEKNWPFLVVVEQSNFIDKKHYGNKYVVYLGNYLEGDAPPDDATATPGESMRPPPGRPPLDKRLKMNSEELLRLYLPYLKKINKWFDKNWIKRKWKFQNPYAQPVFPVNYSRQIPKIKTKTPGVYVANMSMVYPWDRGVNYAVELGQKAARVIMTDRNV